MKQNDKRARGGGTVNNKKYFASWENTGLGSQWLIHNAYQMPSLFSSKPSLRPGQLHCSIFSLEALLIYTSVVFLCLWQIPVQSKIKEEVPIWSPAWENVSPPWWRRHAGGAADAGNDFLILLRNRKHRVRRLKGFCFVLFFFICSYAWARPKE